MIGNFFKCPLSDFLEKQGNMNAKTVQHIVLHKDHL